MHRFWQHLLEPLLEDLRPRRILEIGVDRGQTTSRLLRWAGENDAVVVAIDPAPSAPIESWQQQFGRRFEFFPKTSLEVLESLEAPELALIDGDHNWYTVYHELMGLARTARRQACPLPVICLHDLGWPYGRRDLYYNPSTVPAEHRQPHARAGVVPGRSQLVQHEFNASMNNACTEGGPRNGVRTAVEDFLDQQADSNLELRTIPVFNGFGLLYPRERVPLTGMLANLHRDFGSTILATGLLAAVEEDRARLYVEVDRARSEATARRSTSRRLIATLVGLLVLAAIGITVLLTRG